MRIAATPHTCLCRREEKAEAEASALINEAVQHLQQAGLRKGERGTLADDDVVQYPHIDECQRSLQLLGQHAIRAGRLGDTRGMLVGVMCPVFLCGRALETWHTAMVSKHWLGT
ncbi:hypothetical protein LMG6000_06634 [Achromobacter insolitus]|uniref:Uncharacterized protein n=1 Tax=Achromobacter insolitus TaxID=217204 RepID=A0A6S7FB02_9BURK|nr:hypothetical protein LMG6000_06634 [Achromobacter insolitus]